jgi:TfoX/Sxy family transcriptional regulator of competence genes
MEKKENMISRETASVQFKNLGGERGRKQTYKKTDSEIPRWRLEGGSRKRASYSEILERCWRHPLQAKSLRRDKTLIPPHLQQAQRISTSH